MSADWHRIANLAGLLGSSGDGEVINAARAIDKALRAQGLSWSDFKARIEGGASFRPASRPEPRQRPPDWEDKRAEDEKKARQQQSRRRKGREW